jgi:hypothetical protein
VQLPARKADQTTEEKDGSDIAHPNAVKR